ncbi:unnamed protein product [Amoebophrya sp. A25]|nr:unnamed protein product [Amoebophrya sp. A25]|eukprot:GSA25T00019138001.1
MSRRSSRAGPPPQQLAGSNISGASSTTNGTAQERLDLEQEDTADMQEEGSSMMPRVVSRRSQVRKSTTSSSSTRKSSTAQKEVGPSGLPIMPASTRTDERDEAVLASQESSRASRRSSSGSTSKYPSFSYSVGNVKEIKLVQPRKSEVLEDEEEEDHVLEDEDGRLILDISPSSASSRASRRSGRSFAVVRRSSSSLQDLQDQLRQSKNGVYINDAPRVEDQDYQAEVDASRAGAYQAEVDASSRAVVISPSPREDKQQENTNNMMMNEDSQSKVNIIKAKAEVVSHSQTPRIDPAMDPELLADSRSLTLVPGAKSVQQAFSTLAHGGAEFFDIHTPGEDDNTTTVAAWKPNMNPRPRRRRRIKAQKPHKTMEEKAQAESLREVHTETIAWFRHVRDELLRRLSSTHKVRRSLQEQNLLHLFTAKEYERRHELGLQSTSAEQIGMNDAEEEETSGGVAIPENEMRSDIKNDTASGPNVGEVDVVVDKMNDSEAAAKSTSGNYKDITAEVIIEDNRRETKVDTTLVENVKTASESTSSSTYSTSTKDKEKRVSFKQGPEISKNDTTPPQHQTTTKPQKTSSDRAPATHSPYQHEFYVYTAVESVLVAEALSPDVENLVDEELAGVEGTDEATKAIQREVVLAEIREGKLRFVYDYLQDVLTREERRLVWKAGLRNLSLDQLLDLVLIARTEQLLGSGEMHFDFRRFVRETEPILEVDKRIVERIADVGEVLRNGAETERNKNEEQTSTSFPEQQDQRVRRLPRVEGESSALVGGYHQAEYGEDGFSHEHANHRSALERHWHSTSKGFEASLGIAKYYARGGGGGLLAAPSGGHGGAAGGAVDLGRSADYNSGNPLPEGGGAAKDGEDEVKGRDCSRVEGDDGNYNNNVDGAGGSYQYYPDVDDSTDHDVALEVPSSGLFHYEDFEKTRASERQKDHERVFSFFVEESASSSKKPNVVGQEDQAQEKRRSSRPGVNITPVAERASRSRSSANYSTRTPSDHVVALESPAAPVSVIATSTGSFGRRRSRVSEQNKFMQDQNQKETRRSNEEVSSSRGSDVGTSTRRSSAPSAKNMMMLKQNHELLSTLPENVRRSKHLSSGGSGQGQEGETNMTTEVLEPHITAGQRRSSILRAASSNGTGGGGRGGAVGTSSSNSTSSIMGLRIKSSSSEPRIVEDVTSTNSSKNTNAPHQSPPQGPPGASKPISISTTPSAAATSILTGVPSSSPSASTASSLMRTKSQERWAQLQAKHRSRMFHELAQELRNNHLKDQQEQASAGNGTSTPSSSSTLAKLHIEASRILREAEEMKKYRRSAMETREARTSGVLAALRLQEELQMKEIDDQDEASSSSADTETVMSGVNEDLQETASSTYVVDRKSAIREAVNAEIAARANLVVVDVVAKNASEKIGVSKSGELPGNDVFVKRVVSNVATNSKNYVGVGGEGAPSSRGGTPTTLSSANSSHSRSSTSTTTSVAVAPVTSMAASMGIRIGDRILSVNRTSTERMTQDHFAVALAQRPVCVSFGRRGMLTYDLVTPPVDIVTGLSPWENLRIELEVTLVASESPGSSFSFSPSASVDAPVVVRQLQQAVISSPSEITGSGQSLSSSTFNTALEQQAKQSKPSKTAGIGLSKIGKLPGTALVKRVVPGSAAEEAGIEAGDRIVSMNGMLLNNRKMTEERFRTMVLSERPLKILVATRVVVDNNTKMLNTLFDRRSCATTTSSASKASIDRSALLDEDDDEEVDGIEKGSRTRIVEEVFDVKIDPTTAEDHEDIHIGITKRGDFPGVSLVSRVLPYSIAQMVGVRRGDRIVAVNKVEAAPASSEMWKMTAYGETSGTSGLGVALPSSAVSTPRSTASTRLSRRSSKTSRSKKKLLTEDLYRSMMDMLPLSMRFARFSDVNRENLTFEIVVPSQSSSDEAEINKIGLQKRGTLPGAVTITRVFGYAEQQGVRIGDRLVSINGISTMDMTQEKFEEEMLRRTQAIVPEGREADRDGLTRTSSRTNNNVPAFLASRTSSLNSVSSSRTARTINRTSTTASSRTPPLMLRFARAVPANIVAAAAETSRPQRKNSSVQQVVASSTTLTSSSNSKTPSTSTATTQIIVRCDRDDEKLGIKKLGDLTGGTVAVVRCMTDTGFARLAGVEDGDYIVAVNGESITTFNEDRFQQLILERPLEVSFVRPQGSTVMAVGKTASLLHLEEPDY